MWVLILAVGAALVAFVALAAWQGRLVSQALTSRDCPSCASPLEPVTDGPAPDRSYEVLACSQCTTAVTTVHGARSAFAYCPSCRQLSLELTVVALGPAAVGDLPQLEVQESCSICGFQDLRVMPDEGPRRQGKVIPFPTARRRSGTSD